MPTATRKVDTKGRVILPDQFAGQVVAVDEVSDTEVRIRLTKAPRKRPSLDGAAGPGDREERPGEGGPRAGGRERAAMSKGKSATFRSRGDLVWVQFTPQAGHEQAGHRPAVVVSPAAYNRLLGLALVMPVTNKAKGYPVRGAHPGRRPPCPGWSSRTSSRASTGGHAGAVQGPVEGDDADGRRAYTRAVLTRTASSPSKRRAGHETDMGWRAGMGPVSFRSAARRKRMVVATPPMMTVDQFFKLYGSESNVDLVRGQVVRYPTPGIRHGVVCLNAGAVVQAFVRGNKLGRAMGNDTLVRITPTPAAGPMCVTSAMPSSRRELRPKASWKFHPTW